MSLGGYGQPIPGATMLAENLTYGEHYSTTCNSVGGYLFDETNGAVLTHNRVYEVWGSKVGYSNSSVYVVTP
jgi:hypothetical protein